VELVDDVVQALVPIVGENLVYQTLDDGVDVAVKDGGVVGPGGYNTSWLHDAADLRVELIQVKPVDSRSYRHQVHRVSLDTRILCLGDPVFDLRIAGGLGDHLRTLVGGYDPTEVPRQVRRRLAITRRAIPGHLA